MNDETTELQSLSKLKKAGKLRYWRGTIEIPETELHAICDEIQAEHDHAIVATLEEKPRDRTEERLLNACNQATQDYVTQIERERDEKVSLLETAFERCRELEAERDELKAFSELLETAAHDKLGVTLFGVDYVTEDFMLHVRDTLTAERDEWKAKLADLCREDRVHAKPRTLTAEQVREAIEDVLHDVVSLCFNTWKKPSAFSSYDVDDVMASGNMDEFVKELCELMEVSK